VSRRITGAIAHLRTVLRPALLAALAVTICTGCAAQPPEGGGVPQEPSARQPGRPPATQPPPQPTPPWAAPDLSAAAVPAAYLTAWRSAANRAQCALVAPADPGETGTPRIATFSGGWGVAYDRPGERSAFGVAGTGAAADGASYDWPFVVNWSDGSFAGYGPEGGTGPNQLAYVRIAGQHCLYNVWSRISRSHLQQLLQSLRFVDTRGP
jgi:hypothetical protein